MKHILKIFTLSALTLSAVLAKDVIITIPTPPAVPKVTTEIPKVVTVQGNQTSSDYKTNEEILKEFTAEKVVHFSNHVAPVTTEKKDDPNKIALVGDVKNGMVPAYLHAPLMAPSDIKQTLEKAGFTILASYKIDRKGIAHSIVFTNDELIKAASKKGRGFAAVLHVTIDKKHKLVSITNPLYVLAAFMQKEYDEKLAKKTLVTLRENFTDLKNSPEKLKFRVLDHYQFMQGMPKYSDMQVISKAATAELLKRAHKSKKVLFEQKLLNGSTLLGVKLSKRTSKFIKKTGYQNAGLLPYPVLIEDGQAKILDPKYYIAIMYPMLKMSQFMTIATVPGAIGKDVDRVFR